MGLTDTELLSRNLIKILEGFLFGLPREVEKKDPYTKGSYKQMFTWKPEFPFPRGGTISLIPAFYGWETEGICRVKTNVVAVPFLSARALTLIGKHFWNDDDFVSMQFGEEEEVEKFRTELIDLVLSK